MWAGVLFFLFCVGAVFYIFEHVNIWIQKNHDEAAPTTTKTSSKINLVESIKIEMAETPFLSSKFVFKRVRESLFGFSKKKYILIALLFRDVSRRLEIFFMILTIVFCTHIQ